MRAYVYNMEISPTRYISKLSTFFVVYVCDPLGVEKPRRRKWSQRVTLLYSSLIILCFTVRLWQRQCVWDYLFYPIVQEFSIVMQILSISTYMRMNARNNAAYIGVTGDIWYYYGVDQGFVHCVVHSSTAMWVERA